MPKFFDSVLFSVPHAAKENSTDKVRSKATNFFIIFPSTSVFTIFYMKRSHLSIFLEKINVLRMSCSVRRHSELPPPSERHVISDSALGLHRKRHEQSFRRCRAFDFGLFYLKRIPRLFVSFCRIDSSNQHSFYLDTFVQKSYIFKISALNEQFNPIFALCTLF